MNITHSQTDKAASEYITCIYSLKIYNYDFVSKHLRFTDFNKSIVREFFLYYHYLFERKAITIIINSYKFYLCMYKLH